MRALITGVTGQAGSHLAEQLSESGWEVWGLIRGHRNPKREWIKALVPDIRLVDGDLLDQSSLHSAVRQASPDVVFNMGALTFVGMSWQQPTLMTEVTGLGALRMLEAVRLVKPDCRFVQASSSEMFGHATELPQSETTPFKPRSPYGTAKLFAHNTTVNYRESYGIHASSAIFFNMESTRRGDEFVTRKISTAVARIVQGKQKKLKLGNIDTSRDWGWTPEYMRALQLIAQADSPDDYVVATAESHTVRELCQLAFDLVGLDYQEYIEIDESLFRPADVRSLLGDPSKIKKKLDWQAEVKFHDIVKRLVGSDLRGDS